MRMSHDGAMAARNWSTRTIQELTVGMSPAVPQLYGLGFGLDFLRNVYTHFHEGAGLTHSRGHRKHLDPSLLQREACCRGWVDGAALHIRRVRES